MIGKWGEGALGTQSGEARLECFCGISMGFWESRDSKIPLAGGSVDPCNFSTRQFGNIFSEFKIHIS